MSDQTHSSLGELLYEYTPMVTQVVEYGASFEAIASRQSPPPAKGRALTFIRGTSNRREVQRLGQGCRLPETTRHRPLRARHLRRDHRRGRQEDRPCPEGVASGQGTGSAAAGERGARRSHPSTMGQPESQDLGLWGTVAGGYRLLSDRSRHRIEHQVYPGFPKSEPFTHQRRTMSATLRFDEDASRRVEKIYTTPDVIEQRQTILRALALQPGERAIDIGSGPGLLACEMAVAVGRAGGSAGWTSARTCLPSPGRADHQPAAARSSTKKLARTRSPMRRRASTSQSAHRSRVRR